MDAIVLCFRDEPLREFLLGEQPLEVGSSPDADIVVHDDQIAVRLLLLKREAGAVWAYPLDGRRRARPLGYGSPMRLGDRHSLLRVASTRTVPAVRDGGTQPLELDQRRGTAFTVLVGRGVEARRLPVTARPIVIGSAPGNDLVLHDRTVSARHCRLDATADGVVVRDLGSRNGTWLAGVRVRRAQITKSACLRVGRTDLTLVPSADLKGGAGGQVMIAESDEMLHVLGQAHRYADLDWPVLVRGESGVGKEGVARLLHRGGKRSFKPFVAINAAALPAHTLESELFGHEAGAFTGARGAHRGVFEQAHCGTLFLDEVAELTAGAQSSLLRVLESGELRRVGGATTRQVEVRLVCATHRDLARMVGKGAFRADLFFRLAGLCIEVPPLRDRAADLPALCEHFLSLITTEVGQRALSKGGLVRLMAHTWPGNARELRNVLQTAAASTSAPLLETEDIERALDSLNTLPPDHEVRAHALRETVVLHGGNMAAAARSLGLARTTLRDRLRRLEKAQS